MNEAPSGTSAALPATRGGLREAAQVALALAGLYFLLSLADLLVQQQPFDVQLPVGIVTAAIGGIYLGYLLVAEWRRGTV
ncbi:MAG TPA: hypothetical protein ENN42_06835 [Thioalkalivibrio sp.]|nr:hypothetical protein [Thioalkalivibrio sp.]